MKILHLIRAADTEPGQGHDPAALAAVSVAGLTPGHSHAFIALGSSEGRRRAAWLGVRAGLGLAPVLGRSVLAGRALRRLAAAIETPDVVQCWDHSLISPARSAFEPASIAMAQTEWLDLAPGALEGRGAFGREDLPLPAGVPLIALLSAAPSDACAMEFVSVLGLLEAAGRPVAGLVQAGTRSVPRAHRLRAAIGLRGPLIELSRGTIWDWLACCDAALLPGERPARPELTRPVTLLAHALGVPVAAWRGLDTGGAYPPEARAALAPAPDAQSLAVALNMLLDTPGREGLGAALRNAARAAVDRPALLRSIERRWLMAKGAKDAADAIDSRR